MNPSRLTRRKSAAVEWAELPVELLEKISGGLGNRREIVGFRSVCRSWRFSTPPPPNKLSPLFPHRAPFYGGEPYLSFDHVINAGALYLVRPRSDPSRAWIVAVQEAAAGKLVLRHGISYNEMNGDVGLDLDEDWIAATQTPIARFYVHSRPCSTCNAVRFTQKVVFVSSNSNPNSSGSGYSQLVGLCSYPDWILFAFRLDLTGGGGGFEATQLTGNDVEFHRRIKDYVKFNGRIFAVDAAGHVYLVDHTNLQLVRMTDTPKPLREDIKGFHKVQFVESDGDLYVVRCYYDDPSACEIYRLVAVTDGNNKCIGILREQVDDLGDRVFFLTHKGSFSISGRLLPLPWRQGNCIFVSDFPRSCRCVRDDLKYFHRIFHLGSKTMTRLWEPEGQSYSDLFSPPASFVREELDTLESNPSSTSSQRS